MLRNFKYLFVIFLLIQLFPKTGLSQFLNKNATWAIRSVTYGDTPVEKYEDTQILRDSVINVINYSLFEFRNTLSALREDNKKVFFKVLKYNFPDAGFDTLEHVLYDFNLNEGDSVLLELPSYSQYYKNKWVVREVDSILIGNKLKKRMFLEIPDSYGPGNSQYWIEDIGSTFGPLYFTGISEHEWEIGLFCYRLNNEKLYGKCKPTGLNSFRTDDRISVQIEPILRQFMIKMPTKENCIINIYSIPGAKVYNNMVISNEYIDLTHLKNGLFLFEVKTNTLRHCEKIFLK